MYLFRLIEKFIIKTFFLNLIIENINNKSLLIKELIYIDLRNYNNVIIIILTIMNNVRFNIKIKINTFLVKITYFII